MASKTSQVKPHRVVQVELLRGAAVTAVFLFHAWSAMPEIQQTGHLGYLLARLASWGHMGVVVFNMLTGLVLSLPYLGSSKSNGPSYLAFLQRRFLRILPHYWIALLFWSLLLLGSSSSLSDLWIPLLAHLLFVHTFSPATFFSIVPAYWWLGLLAQFYLVFPLLLRLFKRWGPLRSLLVTSLLCWGSWFILHQLSLHETGGILARLDYLLYFNLPSRLPEFAAGMCLAWAGSDPGRAKQTEGSKPALGSFFSGKFLVCSAIILGLLGFWVPPDQLPLHHPYLSAWCMLLVIAVLRSPLAESLGSLAWIRSLGNTSYSIYLLHQPVLTYGAVGFGLVGLSINYWPVLFLTAALVTLALSLGLDLLVRRTPLQG